MEEKQTTNGSAGAQTGVSVVIERPPEEVFAALADVATHPEWARGPEEIMAISDSPVRLGSTWQQVGKLLGRKLVATMQVNAYEQNREFGFSSAKPFPMQFLFTLLPVPGGTELRMAASGEPSNFFGRVALPLVTRALERQMASDLYELKAILENKE